MGKEVRTLTGHPHSGGPLVNQVAAYPFSFDRPDKLVEALRGAKVLYNTYWIRFAYKGTNFEQAVANTETLIRAAEEAGVRRVVHISITNAAADSPLPYFRGKGLVEDAIRGSGLSYAILRPSIVFGKEDLLINNIAWFLKKFPYFLIGGTGDYPVQPVYVEDLAEMAVRAGADDHSLVVDSVGPEVFTYERLVQFIAENVGRRVRTVHVRPGLVLLASRLLGQVLRDVVLTPDEMKGLMAGLLVSDGEPTGQTSFTRWLQGNSSELGARYVSELNRHYR
jgi:NADH dehydrogenase